MKNQTKSTIYRYLLSSHLKALYRSERPKELNEEIITEIIATAQLLLEALEREES